MAHADEDKSVNSVSVKHKHTVSRGRTVNFSKGPSQNHRKRAQLQKPCENCGGIHETKKCSAFGKTCNNCMKRNYFASVCKSSAAAKPQKPKPTKLNTFDADTDSESDNELYIATIETVNSLAFDQWSETIHVNYVCEVSIGHRCQVQCYFVINIEGCMS